MEVTYIPKNYNHAVRMTEEANVLSSRPGNQAEYHNLIFALDKNLGQHSQILLTIHFFFLRLKNVDC